MIFPSTVALKIRRLRFCTTRLALFQLIVFQLRVDFDVTFTIWVSNFSIEMLKPLQRSLGGPPCPRQQSFDSGITLSAQLFSFLSCCLSSGRRSADGLRFLENPFLLRNSAFITVRLLVDSIRPHQGFPQGRPSAFAHLRYSRGGCLLYSGYLRCSPFVRLGHKLSFPNRIVSAISIS